jgi:hypothetical protein
MSVQDVSEDIKERFESGTDSVQGWFEDMDPELKSQLMTALLGAGGGGILGGLLTGSHVGESPSERRMRLIKNALLGALLGGVGGFGLHRGGQQLEEAFTPTKGDLAEDAETAESRQTGLGWLGAAGGAGVGGGGAYLGGRLMNGAGMRPGYMSDLNAEKLKFAPTPESGGIAEQIWGKNHGVTANGMSTAQTQELFDHLVANGSSPAQARNHIYAIKNNGQPGLPFINTPPRRKANAKYAWKERLDSALNVRRDARIAGQSHADSLRSLIETLFDTQSASGPGGKTWQGTKNLAKGINNRLLPSGGAVGRMAQRSKLPGMLALIAGGGYAGYEGGQSLSDSIWGDDEAIKDYEEAA